MEETPAPPTPAAGANAGSGAELVGLLWGWRRGDALPALATPLGGHDVQGSWRVTASHRADAASAAPLDELGELMARDFALPLTSSARRFGRGHHLYLGWLDQQPVACGWVARGAASMGQPGVSFVIPPGQVYLFAFETRDAWRGRGCYPALLQAMLAAEPADLFWIIHHSSNSASQRGIERAGFQRACAVYALAGDGALALRPDGAANLAAAGAYLLGLPPLPTASS